MKFELERLPRNCSNNDVLDEIRRVANMSQSTHLTRRLFDKNSKISSSTVVIRFGSWGEALVQAGIPEKYKGVNISQRMRKQEGKRMTDHDLVVCLQKVAKKLGTETLTMSQFNSNASINPETIRRRFGSWAKALELAGLKISNLGKRYSEDDYFENLLAVWTHHARQPKYREMDEFPSTITSGAYEAKWGSWRKALEAFVKKVSSDSSTSINPPTVKTQIKKRTVREPNRVEIRTVPLGLRYDVLKRDFFKCVLCGDSPSVNPKCKLQIDHIVPYSRGGKTAKDNLRTLCSRCNQGKGDKTE